MSSRHHPRPLPEEAPWGKDPGQQRGGFGTNILLPESDAIVKKPSWKGTETVIRPYPSVCHEDPDKFWPYRLDPGGRNSFGYWIKRYDCAWAVGNPPVTFLIKHDPNYGPVYDPWQTPLGMLYSAVERACKVGQGKTEWYSYREGSQGKGKALKPPNECCLVQGAILVHESKKLYGAGKVPLGYGVNSPVVIALSSGISKTLVNFLNSEQENYRGDPADFEARYVYGDPVGIDNGRYLHFFEKGHDPRQRYQAHPSSGSAQSPFQTQAGSWGNRGGGGDSELSGFDMFMAKDLEGMPATMNSPEMVENIRNKWRHWEDILYFPTYVQQAHMLANHFPASALVYAFDGYPEWITDLTRQQAVAAVSVAVPGYHVVPPQSVQPVQAHVPGGWNPGPVPVQPAPVVPAPVVPALGAQGSAAVSPVNSPFVGENATAQDNVVPDDSIDDTDDIPHGGFEPPAPTPTVVVPKPDRTAESLARLAAARNKGK